MTVFQSGIADIALPDAGEPGQLPGHVFGIFTGFLDQQKSMLAGSRWFERQPFFDDKVFGQSTDRATAGRAAIGIGPDRNFNGLRHDVLISLAYNAHSFPRIPLLLHPGYRKVYARYFSISTTA